MNCLLNRVKKQRARKRHLLRPAYIPVVGEKRKNRARKLRPLRRRGCATIVRGAYHSLNLIATRRFEKIQLILAT